MVVGLTSDQNCLRVDDFQHLRFILATKRFLIKPPSAFERAQFTDSIVSKE